MARKYDDDDDVEFYETDEDARKPEARKGGFTPRFFLPSDSSHMVTFLDDHVNVLEGAEIDGKPGRVYERVPAAFVYSEHNPMVVRKGKKTFRNYTTCRAKSDDCPLCEVGDPARRVAAFTVVDHHKWKDKDGKTHRDVKMLLVVPTNSSLYSAIVKMMAKLKERKKPLRGVSAEITRGSGRNEAGTGSSIAIDPEYEFDLSEIEDNQPFCYPELLKPMKSAEIVAKFRINVKSGTLGVQKGADDDDDDDDDRRRRPSNRSSRRDDDDDDRRPSNRSSRRRDDDDDDRRKRDDETPRKRPRDLDDDDEPSPPPRRPAKTSADDDDDVRPAKKGRNRAIDTMADDDDDIPF